MKLIKGEIYKTMLNRNHNLYTIFKFNDYAIDNGKIDDIRTTAPYISNMNANIFKFNINGNPCFGGKERTTINANLSEKLWLEACIKANKFIPFKEVMFPRIDMCKINELIDQI